MNKLKTLSSTNLSDEFKASCLKVAALCRHYGVEVEPYHDAKLLHFNSLEEGQKQSALYYLNLYLKLIQSSFDRETEEDNDSALLWDAFLGLGLRQPSDLFNVLEDDDKIEIYDLNGVQIWRNFNVMRICSYTLEEIYSFSWEERYDRSPLDTKIAVEAVQHVLTNTDGKVYHANIKNHEVIERFSSKRYILDASHEYLSPLYGKAGSVSGFVVVSKVKIKGQKKQQHALEHPAELSLVEL